MKYLCLLLPLAGCSEIVIDSPNQPEPSREILAFTASWCGPCQRDKPYVRQLQQQGIKITLIDIDQRPGLMRQYGVTYLPTYIVLVDGVESQRTGDIARLFRIFDLVLDHPTH